MSNRYVTRLIAIFAASAAVIVLATVGPGTFAQSRSQNAGDAFRVSPLRSEITVSPGQSSKVNVNIQNVTPSKATLRVIKNDFVASDKEDGAPRIILDENESAPSHGLKKFMSAQDTVTLGPNEQKTVPVTISIPVGTLSGGYYGAIRFAPVNTEGQRNVSVQGSITSLVLVTVPGNLVENLTVKSFDVTQHNKPTARLSSNKDVKAVIRLDNRGNVQLAPFGDVYVQKGKKVLSSTKINDKEPKSLVLPESTRKWEIPLDKLGGFGKYKVTAVIGYGGSGQTLTVEKTIWVVPAAYIIGFIILLLALIALVLAAVGGLRSYKRRILRQARRGRY